MAEGFLRASSSMALSRDQALVELAKAAREVLLEVAATYRSTISYAQLGTATQRRAGIRAGSTPRWLEDCLTMVIHVSQRLAEPALTSLVVGSDGEVGVAFDEVAVTAGLPPYTDSAAREQAAAVARLECYRRFAPHVPEDAEPTMVTPLAALRAPSVRGSSTPRAPRAPRPGTVARPVRRNPDENRAPFVLCSACFIQTPPGSECQNCGASLK